MRMEKSSPMPPRTVQSRQKLGGIWLSTSGSPLKFRKPDTRLLTAMAGTCKSQPPVQPGNSRGPVLDMGGEVLGVVTYKLNALETMKAAGDLPQNVNFALKAAILRLFLDCHSIPYTLANAAPNL